MSPAEGKTPLTVDELREMHGMPVFVERIGHVNYRCYGLIVEGTGYTNTINKPFFAVLPGESGRISVERCLFYADGSPASTGGFEVYRV